IDPITGVPVRFGSLSRRFVLIIENLNGCQLKSVSIGSSVGTDLNVVSSFQGICISILNRMGVWLA
ncbi:MAG: hypothetical protein MI920_16195, partial [Kiloniellales bacterium]|nr:hypothetical protein [Kiloniellales bacterium]